MNVEHHLIKVKRLETTLTKLNEEEDYEAVLELYMLIAAHYLNAALHHLKILNTSKDIKHNLFFSFLKTNNTLGEQTSALSYAMKQLDDMRPSHIYGRGENGNSAKKAKEHYLLIKTVCEGVLHA